ncbi:hypothetical protein JCM24511_04195 [Saitozyma sp. JCM 24511]|nr:hypothetical protein JCM24511_04195 [Saitozyma sp. JCM 24511]
MDKAASAPVVPFYLGGVSAAMASCCTHPIDQQKYRMQVVKGKTGMLESLSRTARTAGVIGLWEGASASILRQMTYSITRFGVYDVMKSGWKRARGDRAGPAGVAGGLAVWELAACAGLAGGLAGLVGNPAEIVLVRMCTDAVRPPTQQYGYRNCFDGIYRVVRDEGFHVLYRGTGPNVLRSISMNVSQLAAYDAIKAQLVASGYFADTISTHLTTGVLAGTLATTVAAPFDVLKSRIQSAQKSGPGAGVGAILREGWRNEGARFLFRGWTPAWLRLTPNTVLMFVFFEQLKKLWQ